MSLIQNSKVSYMLYNFFHKKELQHNIPLLKKFGINKKYYSSISSKDFKSIETTQIRNENSEDIKNSEFYKNLSVENKASLLNFNFQGYCIIKGFLTPEVCNSVNEEIQNLVDSKELKFKYGKKLMFAIKKSNLIRKIGEDKNLSAVLSILIDGNAKLFQSINFINGSEQKTHSDSIHMTTFPLGGLAGVWVALEDVDADNGALHYYPKSQNLPYYFNSDYDNEGTALMLGNKGYKTYEEMLEKKIDELHLSKEIFTCKKGDMLIWHANILHGGEPHANKAKTRKSMVFHYFDENSICYHEITQRPALFKF